MKISAALIGSVGYALVRAFSYFAYPRPYLWWHVIIDVAMIIVISIALVLVDGGGKR